MNNILETAAVTAVFHRQMNTRDAVRFIMTEANVEKTVAEQALLQAVTYYKSKAA